MTNNNIATLPYSSPTHKDFQPGLLSQCTTFPELWHCLVFKHADLCAIKDDYKSVQLSYQEFYEKITAIARGINALGICKDDKIALFAENSALWLLSDQSILLAGAVDAVRGSQTSVEELSYILQHSESKAIFCDNAQVLKKLSEEATFDQIAFAVLLENQVDLATISLPVPLYSLEDLVTLGNNAKTTLPHIAGSDLATLVYTSGTTGMPKAVMLTHGNLVSQVLTIGDVLKVTPGDVSLCILPTWHIYERTCEYFLMSQGATQVYTTLKHFKNDLTKVKPHYLIGVPRLWESIYEGIEAKLKKLSPFKRRLFKLFLSLSQRYIKLKRKAESCCVDAVLLNNHFTLKEHLKLSFLAPWHWGAERIFYKKIRQGLFPRLKHGISGGGALARYLEDFYESIGLSILVGYGMTETSPVITLRTDGDNVRYSAGKPLPMTEIKIICPETSTVLPHGKTGVVHTKGPQVMRGYYKDDSSTGKVLADGWMNTGDLGWVTPDNTLVLTGREKDIIVLSNGENIETAPIENICIQSPYIDQMILVGQDESCLGALIIPNIEAISEKLSLKNESASIKSICANPQVAKLIKKELSKLVQTKPNYKYYEKIHKIALIEEPFSVENNLLTRTLKPKKNAIIAKYAPLIKDMYAPISV